LSYLVPFENLFITFSSPESAFKYKINKDINAIIEGNDSTFIIYSNDGANSFEAFPKSKNGWKLGTAFSYDLFFQIL
jgi:hypothetical protein